jgi:hypothetical protein
MAPPCWRFCQDVDRPLARGQVAAITATFSSTTMHSHDCGEGGPWWAPERGLRLAVVSASPGWPEHEVRSRVVGSLGGTVGTTRQLVVDSSLTPSATAANDSSSTHAQWRHARVESVDGAVRPDDEP